MSLTTVASRERGVDPAGHKQNVLVTGASGYVGGRLVESLSKLDYQICCLARRPDLLKNRFSQEIKIIEGNLLDKYSLNKAMKGISTAYYLVHSLGSTGNFEQEEATSAKAFVQAAKVAKIKRIIYLGGLINPNLLTKEESYRASPHMRSRLKVGEILRNSGIPTIEFRASVIIGAGSLSFELIRALVQRLPVMMTPSWVSIEAQPISIKDVLLYLVEGLNITIKKSCIYEIGGSKTTSYRGLMEEYARQIGIQRIFLPVPFLTPNLSSLWLGLVTPIFARVGRKLIDSITLPSVISDTKALSDFDIIPASYIDAISTALKDEDSYFIATKWSDTFSVKRNRKTNWGGQRYGSRIVDSQKLLVAASAEAAFAPVKLIGGKQGWYYANFLWKIRGAIDQIVGGVGMKRGRRHPRDIRIGDVIDWWRVVSVEEPLRLTLEAEMKLPGRAWLQFEIIQKESHSEIHQTALFDPVGITGLLYWYLLYFPHQLIFKGMIKEIGKRAEKISSINAN